jgi:hypothetical protein
VTAGSASKLFVFDVSNPAVPVDVSGGGVATGTSPQYVEVQGRYAYLTSSTASKLQVFDLGGTYIQQLEAGGAEFGTLSVNSNSNFAGDTNIAGGLQVGQIIQASGSVSASGSLFVQGSTSFGGGILGGTSINNLSTPGAPTVTSSGANANTVTWAYKIAAVSASGGITPVSTAGGKSSADNSTLTSSNYNTITWSAVSGAVGYKVYRTTASTSPNTTGCLSSCATFTSTSINDTGLTADGSTPPTTDSTGNFAVTGGSATFKNSTNSTAAFVIQDASSTTLFNVDTYNTSISVANTMPTNIGILSSQVNTLIINTGSSHTSNGIAYGRDGLAQIVSATGAGIDFIRCGNKACSYSSKSTLVTGSLTSPAIAVGSDGYARIVYGDASANSLVMIRCTNDTCSSKNVTTVDPGAAGHTVGSANDIVMGSDGFARIAYYASSDNDLKFAQCTNDDCSTNVLTTISTAGTGGAQPSIAIAASDGFARISYTATPTSALQFVQCTNAACSTNVNTTVDSSVNNELYSSLAIASDGFARISYYDNNSFDLRFAQCTNISCSTKSLSTLESTGQIGSFTAIGLGTDGFPRIAYYDQSNSQVKYLACGNTSCTSNTISVVETASAAPSLGVAPDGTVQIPYDITSSGALKLASIGSNIVSGNSVGSYINPFGEIYAKTITLGYSLISDTPSSLSIQGGAVLSLSSTTSNSVYLDSGTTGSVFVGATNNTNAKSINLGNNNAGSTTIIDGGTAATGIEIGNTATAHGIKIGTGAAVQTIVIGSQNSSSALTIQGGSGNVNLLTSTGNVVQIGSATTDANSTLLVLDSYNNSTDPTTTANGAMYYNTSTNTFRCRENGVWHDCLSHHIIELGSDVPSTASTAFQTVTGLSFAVTSGTNYRFHGAISYTTSAITFGLRVAITGPSSPTLLAYQTSVGTNSTTGGACGSASCAWVNAQTTYDAGTSSTSSVSTTTGNVLTLDGVIRPSANGTVQLDFGPETAVANEIVIKTGSTLEWW